MRGEGPDITFRYSYRKAIFWPVRIFFFESFFLFWGNAIPALSGEGVVRRHTHTHIHTHPYTTAYLPLFLTERRVCMSCCFCHSVQLIVMAFMCIVVISFLMRLVLTTATQHPLMCSFIRNWTTKT